MTDEDRLSLCSSIGASNFDTLDVHDISLEEGGSPSRCSQRSQQSWRQQSCSSVHTLCLVGSLRGNEQLKQAILELENMDVVESETGEEYKSESDVAFVLEDFSGPDFNYLRAAEAKIYGPTVILECARGDKVLPRLRKRRPLYCTSMTGVIACLSGFRAKQEVTHLVDLIHHMGGSVRKEFVAPSITHLVTNTTQTDKYRLSISMGKPALKVEWVHDAWSMRRTPNASALAHDFVRRRKLPSFWDLRVSFWGFKDQKEVLEMRKCLEERHGVFVDVGEETSHLVVDCRDQLFNEEDPRWPSVPKASKVVTAEWFWVSIELEVCANVLLYPGSIQADFQASKVLRGATGKAPFSPRALENRAFAHRRKSKKIDGRTSMDSLYDQTSDMSGIPEGMFSTEDIETEGGGGAEKKAVYSKRHQVCLELLQTESNYVDVLRTIIRLFKEPLEAQDKTYLTKAEHQAIFGKVPPILAVHEKICKFLTDRVSHWKEDRSIGDVIINNKDELARCYPHFVNMYDQAKDTLIQATERDPKFNAFLKGIECKAECQRQKLYELLVRPGQRLPSMLLLLKEVLKRTDKSMEDHWKLEKAVEAIDQVLHLINDNKRDTEDRVHLITVFQDIENFPVHLVSHGRKLVQTLDVTDLTGAFKGKKGQHYTLFLFNDVLEVAKKRSEPEGFVPSTPQPSGRKKKDTKSFKHRQEYVITSVREVINVGTFEGVEGLFCLNLRDMLGDTFYPLQVCPPTADIEKTAFLATVCAQVKKAVGPIRADFSVTPFDHGLDNELTELVKKSVKHSKHSVKQSGGLTRNISSSFIFQRPHGHGLKRAVSQAAVGIGGTLRRMTQSRTNLRSVFERDTPDSSFISTQSSSSKLMGKRSWSKRKTESFHCPSPSPANMKKAGLSDGSTGGAGDGATCSASSGNEENRRTTSLIEEQ